MQGSCYQTSRRPVGAAVAKEPPRGPIPPRGGNRAERISALIRDFDQIHVNTPMVNYSGGDPEDGELVTELVAEGGAAIEPLLAALESDTRLTRTFLSRNGIDYIGPVSQAVHGALRAAFSRPRTSAAECPTAPRSGPPTARSAWPRRREPCGRRTGACR